MVRRRKRSAGPVGHRAVSSRHVPSSATPDPRAPRVRPRRPRPSPSCAVAVLVAGPRRLRRRRFDPTGPCTARRQRARRLPGARGGGPEAVPRTRRRTSSTPAGRARPTGLGDAAEPRGQGAALRRRHVADRHGQRPSASRSSPARTDRPSTRPGSPSSTRRAPEAGKNVDVGRHVGLPDRPPAHHRQADRRPERRVVPVGRSSGRRTARWRSPWSRTSSARSRRRKPTSMVVRAAVDDLAR